MIGMPIMSLRRPVRALAMILAIVVAPLGTAQAVDVREVVSPGGITAWLVQDRTVPVTAIEFTFKGAGSGFDPEGREGTGTLLAATMDEGAGPHDSAAFQDLLADQSISISFAAGRDSFSGSFYALNRYRDNAVELLRLALNEPRFDTEPVERVRGQMIVGLRQDETDPGAIASRVLRETIFDGHPYGRPSDGTPESVAAITVEDLNAYRESALTKDRLLIGVVGDITPEELAPILDTAFGALPRTGAPDPVPMFEGAPPSGVVVADLDVPQSTIMFAQPGLAVDDPRYYAGMVLNQVLGGGSFNNRLTEEVRIKRGLAYSVYSFQHAMDKAALLRGGAGHAKCPGVRDARRHPRRFRGAEGEGYPRGSNRRRQDLPDRVVPRCASPAVPASRGNWPRCGIMASGSTISTPETISSRRSPRSRSMPWRPSCWTPKDCFSWSSGGRKAWRPRSRCPKGEGASSAPPAHRSRGFPNRSWDPDRFERFALDRHETVLRRRADRPRNDFTSRLKTSASSDKASAAART
jgi:zinc protease